MLVKGSAQSGPEHVKHNVWSWDGLPLQAVQVGSNCACSKLVVTMLAYEVEEHTQNNLLGLGWNPGLHFMQPKNVVSNYWSDSQILAKSEGD